MEFLPVAYTFRASSQLPAEMAFCGHTCDAGGIRWGSLTWAASVCTAYETCTTA